MKKSVSIIIPNYNGRMLLERYLPHTISVADAAGILYEIIVVDDCSTDESVQFIKEQYPQINILVNADNKGFSYSCNQGIKAAGYELCLLLNSDVKLTGGYFEQQWRYFEMADTFGVMGRIIDMEGDGIQDAARMPKLNGLKLKTDYFYYSQNRDELLYTFYLSGANALIDTQKLKQIGGFYELYSPFYCEDMDLSLRAWRMGWKCYYEHQAICRHQVSASTKNYRTANWVKSIYNRNRYYMHALHYNGLALLLWFLQITFIDLLPKLLTGKFWLWKSYIQLLKSKKDMAQYKKRLATDMHNANAHSSVFEVINEIKKSIVGKDIIKFTT